jgi:hypothetical protein
LHEPRYGPGAYNVYDQFKNHHHQDNKRQVKDQGHGANCLHFDKDDDGYLNQDNQGHIVKDSYAACGACQDNCGRAGKDHSCSCRCAGQDSHGRNACCEPCCKGS